VAGKGNDKESILFRINSPDDLKKLSWEELNSLAVEVRRKIIEVVSKTGGHLASNLGTVELTLALHLSFNIPEDKVIWDVGHQTYTHKLITGRRDRFHTIRQYGGISGFTTPEESPYDIYGAGHASTALSAALGMAVARDLKGENFHVVAVVGDGSLTGGVALEALNNIGYLKKRLIIVLNDNKMSISPNVGAIPGYLNYIISGQFYLKFKEIVAGILDHLPGGKKMLEVGRDIESMLKKIFVPGLLFEQLGIKYIGPISGHSIKFLVKSFEDAKKYDYPVLLHVVTKKGKGYRPAEKAANLFHSAPKFDIQTGKFIKKPLSSYSQVFAHSLIEIGEKDERIVAITAAMPEGTGLIEFAKRFPERFFDVGIAEQHAVLFAAGLASQGILPVVAIYSTFLQRAFDMLYHDLAIMKLPVTIGIDRAGLVGGDGPTHQGIFDIAYLRIFPNFIIMAPKDENELRHMLYTSIYHPGPSTLRYPRDYVVGVDLEPIKKLEIGKSELLQEGEDIVIFAVGTMVYPALKAADILKKEGVKATIVNARFIKPLDEDLIVSLAEKHPAVITIEEGVIDGGFGSAVRELLDSKGIYPSFKRIGIPSTLVPHGARSILLEKYGLTPEGISKTILDFIKHGEKAS